MTRILSSTLIALCLILFVSSCETYEYVDYQAMEDAQKKLLDDFYASNAYKDLVETADTVYESKQDINTGWVFLRKEKGTGDKLVAGKLVGIRYKNYIIDRDSSGNVVLLPPDKTKPNHNYGNLEAELNEVRNCSMKGLDSAFAVLNNYGKGIIIMSSNYWETPSYYSPGSYTPLVIDFEITYYQK